ncbi:MAG: transglutaminase-like domain-containing protein, partial [Defluviitaleaceae bacterium]|nr:transglutaminase-like domain-containing protein [Defluviitaleaceae bacterium]
SRTELESVTIVYNWVVDNIEYDFELARTVRSGFVPDLENVLYNRRGICFCYAALMTAMLRSQGIPTQLVFGFVGDVYHAWISIWTEATGWVNNIIQFNGETWRIMDPTFTSTSNRSLEARNLVGNGENHNPTSWR